MTQTIVAFLAREHGLAALEALLCEPHYRMLQLYTHAHEPKSTNPQRPQRAEYAHFVRLCAQHQIPCAAIDATNAQPIACVPCDFVIEVSWRYLIPTSLTHCARIAAFGIHRGKLPDFAGAEPIKQALRAGEREIVLSAHRLSPHIDGGEIIATASHPIAIHPGETLPEQVARVRAEITPHFPRLLLRALAQLSPTG